MNRGTEGGLLSLVRRWVGPAPDATNDATLLARFVSTRSEDAFATLVDRHGPLVWGLCKRELGDNSSADDALQATFCVLARDASKVRGESLAGWLCRVAVRVARKQSGREYRRAVVTAEAQQTMTLANQLPDAETRDTIRAVHDALASLPDKYRAVLAYCDLEGRTNTEAAQLLNCPVGTVDSRLHTARAKLKDILERKGLAPVVYATAFSGLATSTTANTPGMKVLFETTVRTALAYAANTGAKTDPISTLADGVTTTMTTLKLTVIGGMAAVFLGTAGAGLYMANAAPPETNKTAAPPAKTAKDTLPPTGNVLNADFNGRGGTTASTTNVLSMDAGFDKPLDMTIRDLFAYLSEKYGVTFRVDQALFKSRGIESVYDKKVDIQVTKGLTVKDILDDVASEFNVENGEGPGTKYGYRVKGNQVILGDAYTPASVPGSYKSAEHMLQRSMADIGKAIYGPTVSLSVKSVTIETIVDTLREQTGANIVLDKRIKDAAEPKQLTLVLNDTKLLTALKVAGNMDGYGVAVVDNVYYLTEPANAAKLQKAADKELFGEEVRMGNPLPAGVVTDGVNYYERPATLKPYDFNQAGGALGGAGGKLPPLPEKP